MNNIITRKTITSKLFAVCSALLLLIMFQSKALAQAKQKDALDGKIFTVELTEEKEGSKKAAKPTADEFSFKGGKFRATVANDLGFTNNLYDATQDTTAEGRPVEFTIETKLADTQERFSCEGVVKGDHIEGTANYIRKGKTKSTYTFTGELKAKKTTVKKPAPPVKKEEKTNDTIQGKQGPEGK
jgi:hypothetical protein